MTHLSKNENESLQIWLKELREFQLDSMFDTQILGRAYLYTDAVSILQSSENTIHAQIDKGRYLIDLVAINKSIQGMCSCPFEGNCKHLAALILKLM